MSRVRFRPHQAILVAAVIAFLGAIPVVFGPELPSDPATNPASADAFRWWALPLLLIPVAVFVWALRAGTDADGDGLRLRALFGSREVPWSAVRELATDERGRAVALLDSGHAVALPQVRAADLPRLIAASGKPLDTDDDAD